MNDENCIYRRAALLLRKADFNKDEMSELLGCSPKTSATLRSYYNTCAGIPEVMRAKANAASRESKRRAKAHLEAMIETGDPEVVLITEPWKYRNPHDDHEDLRAPA